MKRMTSRLACVLVLALSCATGASVAVADEVDAKKEARVAYDKGAAAYDAGDFTTATRELSRADELVPNATTLHLALKAALRAKDPVAVMTLVDRAERRSSEGSVAELAKSARTEYASSVGRLYIGCPKLSTCVATLDGASFAVGAAGFVRVGDHAVEVTIDGVVSKVPTHIEPEKLAEINPEAPKPKVDLAPPPKPKTKAAQPDDSRGISPAWFWIATGASVALGAVTTFSALDTASKHSDFVANPSPPGATQGQSAQTRTNVLLGVTAASVAVTGVLGIFVVRWSSPSGGTRVGLVGSGTSFSLVMGF